MSSWLPKALQKEEEPAKPVDPASLRTDEEKQADEARKQAVIQKKRDALNSKEALPTGVRKFHLIIQNIVVTNTDLSKEKAKKPKEGAADGAAGAGGEGGAEGDAAAPAAPPPNQKETKASSRGAHDVYIKFILANTRQTLLQNGKKRKVGKKGKKLKTEVWKRLKPREKGVSQKILQAFWQGEYANLEKEELDIQVWDWDRFSPNDKICSTKLRLLDLATGSVRRSIQFVVTDKSGIENEYCLLEAEFIFSEIFPFELNFTGWSGRDLKAADVGPFSAHSSDPFVKFSIDGPTFPRTRGIGRGRTTKTAVMYNTLFPVWPDCKKPLYFTGTRAQLENEMLNIDVYDWDLASSNDLIGQAVLPMLGILDTGFAQISLGLEETDPENKKQKVWNEYGSIQGHIKPASLPPHTQIGLPVVLREGVTYLAVKIVKAENLRPADVQTSDPFFRVEWDNCRLDTPVQYKTLNPTFECVLYFPVKARKISQQVLENKGDVKLTCLDWDDTGSNDLLGTCEFGLSEITASLPQKGASETSGKLYSATLQLMIPKVKVESTVSLKAWFTPDLPPTMVIEAKKKQKAKDLPKAFKEQHKEWKAAIPKRANPNRDAKFSVAELDETNTIHFLSEYLAPFEPPSEDHFPFAPVTPEMIARMVRCLTFASDKECFGSDVELWVSPKFFLDMRKGDSDAHAVLLCNFFLGLKLDAYVCVGKMEGKYHTWVMTREPDGTVRFWETMKGRAYVLEKRWYGTLVQHDNEPENDKQKDKQGANEPEKKKKRKKALTDEELADQKRKELEMMFYDDDEIISSTVIQRVVPDGGVPLQASNLDDTDGDDDAADEEVDLATFRDMPKVTIPYQTLEVVFNHENIWANIQAPNPAYVTFDFEPERWSAFIHGWVPKPFYQIPIVGSALPEDRCNVLQKELLGQLEESLKAEIGTSVEFDSKMRVELENGLEILEEAYAQQTVPAQRKFDAWKGKLQDAIPPGSTFEGTPVTFSHTDAKRINRFLFDQFQYHEEAQGCKFVLAVKLISYPAATIAVWVYYGRLRGPAKR